MEKTFLLHLSAHWGDLIEQIKKICHIHFKLSIDVQLGVDLPQVDLMNFRVECV